MRLTIGPVHVHITADADIPVAQDEIDADVVIESSADGIAISVAGDVASEECSALAILREVFPDAWGDHAVAMDCEHDLSAPGTLAALVYTALHRLEAPYDFGIVEGLINAAIAAEAGEAN